MIEIGTLETSCYGEAHASVLSFVFDIGSFGDSKVLLPPFIAPKQPPYPI